MKKGDKSAALSYIICLFRVVVGRWWWWSKRKKRPHSNVIHEPNTAKYLFLGWVWVEYNQRHQHTTTAKRMFLCSEITFFVCLNFFLVLKIKAVKEFSKVEYGILDLIDFLVVLYYFFIKRHVETVPSLPVFLFWRTKILTHTYIRSISEI